MSDKIPVNYFPMKGGGNLETYAPRTLYGISSNLVSGKREFHPSNSAFEPVKSKRKLSPKSEEIIIKEEFGIPRPTPITSHLLHPERKTIHLKETHYLGNADTILEKSLSNILDTDKDEATNEKTKKLQRNRESAYKSREKKKVVLAGLKGVVEEQTERREKMRMEMQKYLNLIQSSHTSNMSLRGKMDDLQGQNSILKDKLIQIQTDLFVCQQSFMSSMYQKQERRMREIAGLNALDLVIAPAIYSSSVDNGGNTQEGYQERKNNVNKVNQEVHLQGALHTLQHHIEIPNLPTIQIPNPHFTPNNQ